MIVKELTTYMIVKELTTQMDDSFKISFAEEIFVLLHIPENKNKKLIKKALWKYK